MLFRKPVIAIIEKFSGHENNPNRTAFELLQQKIDVLNSYALNLDETFKLADIFCIKKIYTEQCFVGGTRFTASKIFFLESDRTHLMPSGFKQVSSMVSRKFPRNQKKDTSFLQAKTSDMSFSIGKTKNTLLCCIGINIVISDISMVKLSTSIIR